MADLAKRFTENPLLTPADIKPSLDGLQVKCAFNPGAFRYNGRTGILMRVAEFAPNLGDTVRVPILDATAPAEIRIDSFDRNEPTADWSDQRKFWYKGHMYLTSLSHLRMAWSDDGKHFTADESPLLIGEGPLEEFGIEDVRVSQIDEVYYLTYTQVSYSGVGVGLITTRDWQSFKRCGMIFPPHNKDCAIFEKKIGGDYLALHRPSGLNLGGNYIWLARSPDLLHWGEHTCLCHSRPGQWDSERIGAGCAPIETEQGWLAIYHGTDANHRYCLGALLLDKKKPATVLARSAEPIMEPTAPYEQNGFFGNCIFTNGHVVDGDTLTVYYGASDTVVCGATLSISEILGTLQ